MRLTVSTFLIFCLHCVQAQALEEFFNLYDAPQALAMGNAHTADAEGHIANYYNPAGLAKANKRRPEFILFAFDAIPSGSGLSTAVSGRTFGLYHLFDEGQNNPGRYSYYRFNLMPAYSRRNFAIAVLGSYEYAALSDGSQVDVQAKVDVAPTVGYAMNFAGNLLKLGVTAKAIIRNQLNGIFDHSQVDGGADEVDFLMDEGIGFGADVGLMMTLPNKYLPTLGIVWKDALNTHFSHSNILNKRAPGTPGKINQSVNAAISVHPYFSKGWKGTISLEVKHLERTEVSLRKRIHFGVQLVDMRSFFVWGGLNQLYFTAGIGLRVKGGNLEIGSYAQDVGAGNQTEANRRFFLRYTISF